MALSIRRRLIALAFIGAAGLLIAVFVLARRANDKHSVERADSSTQTSVPSPAATSTPDPRPLVFDIVTHELQAVSVPSDTAFPRPLSDGTLLMVGVGSPPHRSAVVRRDGTQITRLPPAPQTSTDGRYVAWADDQGLRAYEAGTGRIGLVPPRSIAGFPSLLPWGGGFARDVDGQSIDIFAGDGSLLRRLDMTVGASSVIPSPDGRSFAWDDGAGLHIYNLNTNAERVYADIEWVPGGEMSWSPDGSQLAVLRLTGDNVVHIEVVSVASGVEREIFHGERAQTIALLPWLARHALTIRITDPFGFAGAMGALRILTDDGGASSEVPEVAELWRFCGPACGLPPATYEVDHSIASWCDLQGDESCQFRLAYVDRAHGDVSEIADSECAFGYAVSPNGRTLAMVLRDDVGNQALRLVKLDDLSYDDYALPWAYGYSLQWFPDGTAIVLAFAGN